MNECVPEHYQGKNCNKFKKKSHFQSLCSYLVELFFHLKVPVEVPVFITIIKLTIIDDEEVLAGMHSRIAMA